MQLRHLNFVVRAVILSVLSTTLQAQDEGVPTKVMVRAVSMDAKVIGTNVGGARITIRDAATGATLAEGLQEGGTGDTELIMVHPRWRGAQIYDQPSTAGFLVTLKLKQPMVVEVTAEGPLGYP